MCSIVHLKANVKMPEEALFNAVYNNWHSYGLVTKIDGKLLIQRVVPKDGEIDPEEVARELHKNQEYERFLHLRHNTAGTTSLENCHPFDILYSDNGPHVVWMHNGTMHEYKSREYDTKAQKFVDDDTGPSDTQNFTNDVLIPYTSAMNFGGGVGDISHPLYRKAMNKLFPVSNRGVIISNLADPFFLGDWKKITKQGVEFYASNDEYFDKTIRGPKFERDKKAAEEARKQHEASRFRSPAGQKASSFGPRTIEDINNYASVLGRETEKPHRFFELKDSINAILADYRVYEAEGAAALANLTKPEFEALMQNKDVVDLFMYAFHEFQELFFAKLKLEEEFKKVEEKHSRASVTIADRVEELRALKKGKKYVRPA